MKKIFLSKVIATACLFIPLTSQGVSPATAPFNVTVTLVPECTIGGIANLAFPTYTAFGTGVTATSSATVLCTRGLTPVNAEFDTTGGIGSTGGAATTGPVITGAGVINGLQYQLFALRTNTPGTAATAASIGGGDQSVFGITGTIPAGQAGAVPPTSPQTRTLRIIY